MQNIKIKTKSFLVKMLDKFDAFVEKLDFDIGHLLGLFCFTVVSFAILIILL